MALVAMGDELEQGAGLDLVLADVGQVVEDDEIELVELVEHRGQAEVASCGLELLDHVGCGAEQDTSPGVDAGMADGSTRVRLAGAAMTEQQQIATALNPVRRLARRVGKKLVRRYRS